MGVIFLLHETKHLVINQLPGSLHPLQDTNMKKTCPNNPCLPYYLQASLLSSPLYNLTVAKGLAALSHCDPNFFFHKSFKVRLSQLNSSHTTLNSFNNPQY